MNCASVRNCNAWIPTWDLQIPKGYGNDDQKTKLSDEIN